MNQQPSERSLEDLLVNIEADQRASVIQAFKEKA